MSTGEEVRKLSAGRPLSAEAVEFSPAPATEQQGLSGWKTMSIGISPTEVAELPLSKAEGGVRFTAVVEVHRPLSTDDEGEILAQPSGQQVVGNTYPGKAPVMSSAPRGDTLFSKPEMHPAQMKVLDGIPMEEVECLEPLLTSVPVAPLDSKPMAGNRMRNSSDVAVPQKDQTGRPMEGVTSPTPSRRSVTPLHFDSQPSGYKSMPDWPRDPVSDDIPQRQAKPPDNKTGSYGNKDNAVQMAPSELAPDATSGSQSEPFVLNPVPDAITENRNSEERSLSERSWQTRQSSAQTDQPEYTESPSDSGEAIVVGAIGSAAPWFLTGWAHDVEIEFMIDAGCQVTILSATVFQRMCVVKPEVCSALQICRHRLVSADSSPLTVQGQLELDIVFPGLCCKMLFVVANIGSDGLLSTEALQSYLPHQLDLRTGQLWADGWSTLQLHQQRLTPDMDGLLTTSVVISPDSEIVAKFSVSGIPPHGCVLVEPARQLIEEYGILVGHTLADASSGSGSVLIVNPNEEVVVLPGLTFIGKLVPVAAISVAMEDTRPPVHDSDELP